MIAASKRVLVMDDEEVVCKSYERVLGGAGFEVDKAHDGLEALRKLRQRKYDVVLADLKMPGMDGLEVVEKLREFQPGMPVVVITGYPSQDTLQAAARLSVVDYLTKPVPPDVLTRTTMEAVSLPSWSRPDLHGVAEPPLGATAVPLAMPVDAMFQIEPDLREPELPVAEARVAPKAQAEAAEPGTLRTVLHLACVPVISIAYVVFLPLIGFGLFFGLGAQALARKLSPKEA